MANATSREGLIAPPECRTGVIGVAPNLGKSARGCATPFPMSQDELQMPGGLAD